MTKEQKQVLLEDICARLPYGVKANIPLVDGDERIYTVSFDDMKDFVKGYINIKPYLRPMSSITDNEREDWYRQSKVDYDCEFKPEPTLSLEYCHLSIDWLNKYGFDYRGLIPMGLALEAPEGMYDENC